MFVSFRDYAVKKAPAAPVGTLSPITAVAMARPTPSQLIAAVRSSEIVVRMVDDDRDPETPFALLWIYNEETETFEPRTLFEDETLPPPDEDPERLRLPSILFDGERWITVDYEDGFVPFQPD